MTDPADQEALARLPEHATETHQTLDVMRQERRQRVASAFGASEVAYLEALEDLYDHTTNTGTLSAAAATLVDRVFTAEQTAAEKGRH